MKNPQEKAFCIAVGRVHPGHCIARFLGIGFLPMVMVSLDARSHCLVSRVGVCHDNCIRPLQPLSVIRVLRSFEVGNMLDLLTSCLFALCALSLLNRKKHGLLSDPAPSCVEQLTSRLRRPVSRKISVIERNCASQLNRCACPAHSPSNLLYPIPTGSYRFMPNLCCMSVAETAFGVRNIRNKQVYQV